MNDIRDLNIYTKRMENGLQDKLFFIPYLSKIQRPFIFIDYGCANGILIETILKFYPNSTCIGLDCNEDMLTLAKERCSSYKNRVFFCQNLEELKEFLAKRTSVKILNMSSVLHEVHHYSKSEEVERFYKDVLSLNVDYIFIRDMYNQEKRWKYISQENFIKLKNNPLLKKQINDFEGKFGSIIERKNCIHFLLKYKYLENWDREVAENYFPDIPLHYFEENYDCEFRKEYQLPYFTKLWKDELNVEINSKTHIQLIYKKKKVKFTKSICYPYVF